MTKSPTVDKQSSRIGESVVQSRSTTQTCRKKVESLISRMKATETDRKNKENFRRVGAQIINSNIRKRTFIDAS